MILQLRIDIYICMLTYIIYNINQFKLALALAIHTHEFTHEFTTSVLYYDAVKKRKKREKREEKRRKREEKKRRNNHQPYMKNCTFSRINQKNFPPPSCPPAGEEEGVSLRETPGGSWGELARGPRIHTGPGYLD